MSELLNTYNWNSSAYGRIPGTDDWVEVARLGDQGGYDWCDFNVFYSPSARRYFWHGDRGCSCNSWQDDISTAESFQNGDRESLLRAWETFAKDNEYSVHISGYLSGVTEIKNFEESK